MTERHQRQRVLRALKTLDAIPVENRDAMPGTPDVAYIGGWIELKWLRDWPKRGGVVSIHHYTPQQRVWLKRHWLRGGNSFLLLQVANEWLLFDGNIAAEHVGLVPRDILYKFARRHWDEGLKDAELRELLENMPKRKSIYG